MKNVRNNVYFVMSESSVFRALASLRIFWKHDRYITGYPTGETQSADDSKTGHVWAEQERQHCCSIDFLTPEPHHQHQPCFSPSTSEEQLVPLELPVQEPRVPPWRWIQPASSHTRLPKNGGAGMTRTQADVSVCCSTSAISPLITAAHPTLSSSVFV